jgi:MarR family transcriptional regulator, organic hydroperoxide resistance regulator
LTRIAQELKQTRPFHSARAEAVVGLLRTADLISRMIGVVVEPRDITAQQYNVLRILRGAADAGLPTLEIAERMIEQTPGITRLLDRLESKKLVARERCTKDRRRVYCRITSAGLALLKALDAPIRAAEEQALADLTAQEVKSLVELLDRTRDSLRAAIRVESN